MREYAPVSKEVDMRVDAVRDAWAVPTKERFRSYSALDKNLAEVDRLVTEILYLEGDPADLVARIDNVRMYLPPPKAESAEQPKDLTVQTFFENQLDLALRLYSDKVLKYNLTVKGPTELEREQVKITNEYRLMFG